VLPSRSRKEPHLFGGAGAVTRCGSGSKLNDEQRWITKNVTTCKFVTVFIVLGQIYNHFNRAKFRGQSSANTYVNFCLFLKSWLAIYRYYTGSRIGAGAASKLLPGAGAA
jgi:hypothetical protein